MAVNREDLARLLAEKSGETLVHSLSMLNDMIDVMCDVLGQGEMIHIREVCKMKVAEKAARVAWNFKTKQTTPVPARRYVKFEEGKLLKERIESCKK